jgi:hypothetical protein
MGGSLDPAYRENLRKVVDSIEQKLVAGDFTPIDIAVEPATAAVSIEGGKPYDEDIVGGGRSWVPYGAYRFVVRAPGYAERRSEVTANGHAAMPLRVTLEKEKAEALVETGAGPSERLPIFADEPVVAKPSKTAPVIATSLTGAAAVVGLVFYFRARGFVKDAESPTLTRDEYDDLHDKAHSNQRIAWVAGGVAGVGAIASGILWWRYSRASRVEVTSTGNGVAIRGRF